MYPITRAGPRDGEADELLQRIRQQEEANSDDEHDKDPRLAMGSDDAVALV